VENPSVPQIPTITIRKKITIPSIGKYTKRSVLNTIIYESMRREGKIPANSFFVENSMTIRVLNNSRVIYVWESCLNDSSKWDFLSKIVDRFTLVNPRNRKILKMGSKDIQLFQPSKSPINLQQEYSNNNYVGFCFCLKVLYPCIENKCRSKRFDTCAPNNNSPIIC
jgi:hypothetical protein